MLNVLRRVRNKWMPRHAKISFSQCGEDLIIQFLLRNIYDVSTPTYLDIGANHPFELSNTYLFYKQGCQGVCVEPDPQLAAYIQKHRPRDTVLAVGLSDQTADAKLHVFNDRAFNTLSQDVHDNLVEGQFVKPEGSIPIKLMSVSDLMRQHYPGAAPDFVSLDTEGMELQILSGWDLSKWRPRVFCIETLTSDTWLKNQAITDLMQRAGYEVYADTNLNTIYVEGASFADRRRALGRSEG